MNLGKKPKTRIRGRIGKLKKKGDAQVNECPGESTEETEKKKVRPDGTS